MLVHERHIQGQGRTATFEGLLLLLLEAPVKVNLVDRTVQGSPPAGGGGGGGGYITAKKGIGK